MQSVVKLQGSDAAVSVL